MENLFLELYNNVRLCVCMRARKCAKVTVDSKILIYRSIIKLYNNK